MLSVFTLHFIYTFPFCVLSHIYLFHFFIYVSIYIYICLKRGKNGFTTPKSVVFLYFCSYIEYWAKKMNFIYSPVFFFTLTIIIIMNISKLQQELVSHLKCTCNNSTCLFVYHQKVCVCERVCIQKHNKKLVCFCKLNTHKCVCKKFKNKLFFFLL